jgi:hypothetical protein
MKRSRTEIEAELADICRDLDRWEQETKNPGDLKEISALRMRAAAIEKHLDIEKKIAA